MKKSRWNGCSAHRRTRTCGNDAEQRALAFLLARGLQLVTRNFHCRLGEIDLVMLDGDCLVIVEVRCRTSMRFVAPALTVDERKQGKIARATAFFLATKPSLGEYPVRFDVVAVDGANSGDGAIEWIPDAFRV